MTSPTRPTPTAASLEDLCRRFDVFFIDQFGVLHDGIRPYSGAIEALAALKRAGKKSVLLSNSGKRSAPNRDRLQALGFDRQSYDLFLSSGEVAWALLKDTLIGRIIPDHAKCLLLARDDDISAIAGLNLVRTHSGEDAELVVISGSRGDDTDLETYRKNLIGPASRNVPCLCTNPDKKMLTAKGLRFGAGAIADLYMELGGKVTWIGKPHGEIYRAALAAIGEPDLARVCCLGDSVEHDIAGGAAAGLSTVLVRTGIHADADNQMLSDLFAIHDARPNFVLGGFSV